jgi:hypothetical protein
VRGGRTRASRDRTGMVSRVALQSSLQSFLLQRGVAVRELSLHPATELMIDWFRLVAIDGIPHQAPEDTLVFRYGGWSEGCATGFKIRTQRRIALPEGSAQATATVGIALLFASDRFGNLEPLATSTSDWRSLEAFVAAIESSPGFLRLAAEKPSEVLLEVDETR